MRESLDSDDALMRTKTNSQVHSSTGSVCNTRQGSILCMRRVTHDLEGVALPLCISGKCRGHYG